MRMLLICWLASAPMWIGLVNGQDDQPIATEPAQAPAQPEQPPAAEAPTETDPAPDQTYLESSNRPVYTRVHHTSTAPLKDPLRGMKIVCLYNNKNFEPEGFRPKEIDPFLCTHINYEFAMLDPKTYEMLPGQPDLDLAENLYDEVVELKKRNPRLKVLLSLGGWDDSTRKYSELVDSAERVDNFIEKAVQFLQKHEFDGLDVAWEYPNCWQGALGVSPKDKKNFAEFLEKVRNRFDKENLELSISVGAIKREILAAYEGPTISKAVHHINVMAYDMHGPWEKRTGHHAQFERRSGDPDPYSNAKTALDIWTGIGVDRRKLILGLPAYAKTFTLSDPNNKGMGAPTIGPGKAGGYLCYNVICQWLNDGNWTENEDHSAGFYAYSGDQWAAYDPPMMAVRKGKFVVESGAGGILVKDVSCDDHVGTCYNMPNPLLRMLRLEMISKISRMHKQSESASAPAW